MASYSNTDTGSKAADPYKERNLDESPSLKEKVTDLVGFVESCGFGMMVTRDAETGRMGGRCMALAAKETGGIDLLFYTNTESGKTNNLSSDPHINISFLNASGEWASVSGRAEIVTDRAVVKRHYSPSLKAWMGDLGDGTHDGGPDDPRIGVIRVRTETAVYALVKKSLVARAAEVAKGAVTGKAASVNRLRELSEGEVATWRESVKMVE